MPSTFNTPRFYTDFDVGSTGGGEEDRERERHGVALVDHLSFSFDSSSSNTALAPLPLHLSLSTRFPSTLCSLPACQRSFSEFNERRGSMLTGSA